MTRRLAPLAHARTGHVTVPRWCNGHDTRRLTFTNGVEAMRLSGTEFDALADARFAAPHPTVRSAELDVYVDYPAPSRVLRRTDVSMVRLTTLLPWAVEVHGVAAHMHADLSAVDLRALTFHGGQAHCRIDLPPPSGTCLVQLAAVRHLHLSRPADVPVRIEVMGTARGVVVDDRRYRASFGGLVVESPDYADGTDRYLVSIGGGVDRLDVAGRLAAAGRVSDCRS